MENNEIRLMNVCFGGVSLEVPQIWNVETEMYTEPDGRECAMIDIEAGGADPRSITISYGPMPEGAFFISNNTFYQIPRDGDDTNNNKSKAFRAYLMPQGAAAEARALSYRTDGVVDEDENGTSVGSATGGVTVVAIYNTQGERLTDLQDGINILQMSDGTTMKVVIR